MIKSVVILSNNDWNDFWYQRQQYAQAFAARGYNVYFFNKTFTRMPSLLSFLRGNYASKNRGYVTNRIPVGVQVLTPLWLPPYRVLRPINRLIISRTLRKLKLTKALLLIYSPTYNAVDFLDLLKPHISAYINVHNYEEQGVMRDLLSSELEIIQQVDHLFADSRYNQRRLMSKIGNRSCDVHLSPPGVALSSFQQAYRGDESSALRSIAYYGGIGDHLDFALYGNLARKYRVVFIGKLSPNAEKLLPQGIEIWPPIINHELGAALREFDALAIFYKEGPYIDAVIPAKFYECLATRKPLLVSGLKELKAYKDVIYDVQGSSVRAEDMLEGLPKSETEEKRNQRWALANDASWDKRFETFSQSLGLKSIDCD